jgi:hypothetical protein
MITFESLTSVTSACCFVPCTKHKILILYTMATSNKVATGTATVVVTTTDVVDDVETTVTIGSSTLPKLNWTRLNYKGDRHDTRRIVEHRARDCRCEVCYLEINKLPPPEPLREKYKARKLKSEERNVKRTKNKAKQEVKDGKQACIRNFFRY